MSDSKKTDGGTPLSPTSRPVGRLGSITRTANLVLLLKGAHPVSFTCDLGGQERAGIVVPIDSGQDAEKVATLARVFPSDFSPGLRRAWLLGNKNKTPRVELAVLAQQGQATGLTTLPLKGVTSQGKPVCVIGILQI